MQKDRKTDNFSLQSSTQQSPALRRTPSIMARLEDSAPLSPVYDVNENLDDSLEATEVGGMDAEESLAEDIVVEDDQEIEKDKPIRGKNKVYELIEVFWVQFRQGD